MTAITLSQTLEPVGPATALFLDDDAVARLAGGAQPPVVVTVGERSVRARVMRRSGRSMIGLSRAARDALGVDIGDAVEATIVVDDAPREVDVPDDLAEALTAAGLREQFDRLAFTHRKEHVRAVDEAKRPETRARRIAQVVEKLRGT